MSLPVNETTQVPPRIQRFIKTLVVTAKAVLLYPPSSEMPIQTAQGCADALSAAVDEFGEVVLGVTKEGLTFGGVLLVTNVAAYRALAVEFYQRRLAEVVFHRGTGAKEIVGFLSVLGIEPEDLDGSGGYEHRLWEMQIDSITVTQAHVSLATGTLEMTAESGLTDASIDDPDAEAVQVDRSQLHLQRFTSDHENVARRLLSGWGDGGADGIDAVAAAFAEYAQAVSATGSETEKKLMAGDLKDSLLLVDPAIRRRVLAQRILAEATTNASISAVLRDMSVGDVAHLLLSGVGGDEMTRSGISRAIRIMSQVSGQSKEETGAVFGETMRQEGISDGFIAGVLQATSPRRFSMRQPPKGESVAVTAAVKLINLVPAADRGDAVHSEEISSLIDEVETGISDGDVVMALLALCSYDVREAPFSSTMSVLEDSLDVLLGRGELEKAAEAVEALRSLAGNPSLSPAQRRRVELAASRLTKPSDIQAVVFALRHQPVGSREHDAAKRLLEGLGPFAIDSLVTRLAEEPDMAMRKTIVEILTELVPGHVEDLGAFVTDARWYVVRNVVSVLGSVKDPRTIRYLRRSMRHIEARVRREAIRALGGMPFTEAHELLVLALNDSDAQVVQLACRFLGAARFEPARAAIANVARGQSSGNHETTARCEAIDALVRIGGPDTVGVLQSLTRRRAFGGAGGNREVRSAAEAALSRLNAGGGGR